MYARRVALFILRDKEDKVLLQHRYETAKLLPDYWAFFGGGIEEGETPEQAVAREAKEELGIELKDFRFFKRYEAQEEPGLFEKFVYTAPLEYSLDFLRKKQEEGKDLGLFSFDELKSLKISDNDRIVLEDLFRK